MQPPWIAQMTGKRAVSRTSKHAIRRAACPGTTAARNVGRQQDLALGEGVERHPGAEVLALRRDHEHARPPLVVQTLHRSAQHLEEGRRHRVHVRSGRLSVQVATPSAPVSRLEEVVHRRAPVKTTTIARMTPALELRTADGLALHLGQAWPLAGRRAPRQRARGARPGRTHRPARRAGGHLNAFGWQVAGYDLRGHGRSRQPARRLPEGDTLLPTSR